MAAPSAVPFVVKFWKEDEGETGPPELKADPTLKDRLKAEAEGILAFMVEGCREWLADDRRLTLPEAVGSATRDYRSEENLVGRFVEERCIRDPKITTTAKKLYAAFKAWCEAQDERPESQRRFGEGLAGLGFVGRQSNGTVYDQIKLVDPIPD